MEKGRTGHKYIFSTEFKTVDALMDIYEAVTGRRRPRSAAARAALMLGIAHVTSRALRLVAPNAPQRFTPGAVRILGMQRRAEHRQGADGARLPADLDPPGHRGAVRLLRGPGLDPAAAPGLCVTGMADAERAAGRDRPAPPALSGGLPWLGHALAFRRDPVAFLLRAAARLGDVFSFRLAGIRVTALTGPAAQAAFFQAPEDQLSAREAYRFMRADLRRGRRLRRDARRTWTPRSGSSFPRCGTSGSAPTRGSCRRRPRRTSSAGATRGRRPPGGHERADGVHRQPLPGRRATSAAPSPRSSPALPRPRGRHQPPRLPAAAISRSRPPPAGPARPPGDAELIARVVAERRARGSEAEDFLDALM